MSFIFHSNRAPAVFNAALQPLGGKAWQSGDRNIDLLYFDDYGGKTPPAGVNVRTTLIDRQRTIPLDQKKLMALRLQQGDIDFPPNFFEPELVPGPPDGLWFVKDPFSSGGTGLTLCRRSEVEQHFKPGFVIQQALTDVAMYAGRKFTIRTYVLVHANRVYWYPDAFLVVHAKQYEKRSLDPAIHFQHNGYMEPQSGVKLVPTQDYYSWPKLEFAIVNLLQMVFSLYRDELGPANPPNHYCVFGIDLLALQRERVALIEINDRPNLLHTDVVNQRVNQPMLQAMARLLLPERIPDKRSAQRFEELLHYA